MRLFHHQEIDSTSSEAQRLTAKGELAPFAVSADSQTHGRGRMSRTWSSPKGNLYLTLVLPGRSLQDLEHTPCLTALLLAKWMEFEFGFSPSIKWPNDLLHRGRKFCGILCESTWNGNLVGPLSIGIGLNLKRTTESERTSIEEIIGQDEAFADSLQNLSGAESVVESLLGFWRREWPLLSSSAYLGEYEKRHISRGQVWVCKKTNQFFRQEGFNAQAHMQLSPLGGGPSFPVVSAHTHYSWVYQDQMASFHGPLFVGEFFVRGGTYFFRLGLFQSASGPLVSEIFEWRGEGTPCQPSTFWSSQIPARPWPIFMANLQPRFGQLEWIKSLFPGGNLCLVEKRNIFLRDQARPSSDHLARTVGDFFPKTSEPWTSTRSDLLFEGLRSHVLG